MNRVNMPGRVLVYEWHCPVCGQSKAGLGRDSEAAVERQAANAFRQHLTAGEGAGHGGAGEFPPRFDPATVTEYIEIGEASDDRTPLKP